MLYQDIARADVMQRYPALYPEINSDYEFIDCHDYENDAGQELEADLEEVAARKEEATRKVREKLEALMRQQADAKAIKATEDTASDLVLASNHSLQDNHSDKSITDLALVDKRQCVSILAEGFGENQERSVVLWNETTTNHIQRDMTKALEAAKLDETTKRKVHGELLALFRQKSEMQGVKTDVENGLLYEESVAIEALDGADERDMRRVVYAVACIEGRNVSGWTSSSCTDMIQWQSQHEDVLIIEEGVECMKL